MVGVIAKLTAVEGLWADGQILTGEASIVAMRVEIVKPAGSLPGLLRWASSNTSQALGTRYYAVIYTLNTAYLHTPYVSCVTYLSEPE